MDPEDVERKTTPRPRAIIVVHLFGNPCNMDAMVEVAKRHNIPLIEDCAQAHMTEYKGKYVGTIGDIGCFSFQQAKHMTTGDGGMTITSNKAYYDHMKFFVDKGYARKSWGPRAYLFHAPNYRMNELTGAVGLAQLKKVKKVVDKRHELGEYLTKLLSGTPGIRTAPVTGGAGHSYWLYPLYLETADINKFAEEMKKESQWVSAGYTVKPIYLCAESLTAKKTYGQSGCPFTCKYTDKEYEYKEGLCPRAEEALRHLICIPLNESWDKQQIESVSEAVKKSMSRLAGETKQEAIQIASSPPAPRNDKNKIRIGIVGCGQMGKWHLDAYKLNPLVELAAFADTNISLAQKFSAETRGNAYSSHKDMIKNEKLNGVSICTIPSSHKEIVLDLLNAGVNVLCEKPLAISSAEAQEMTAKAQEKGLLLLTAFKFRFFDEVLRAKELLEKQSLGKILNFRLMFGGYMDMEGTWYAKKELSGGGIIMDTAPHAIDLIRYLLGEIKTVSAQISNYQNISVEDTAKLTFVLASGASGTADISWSNAVPSPSYLEIYGEDGSALLDLKGISYKFKTWGEWKRIPNKASIKEAFARQTDHFVDGIKGKPPSITVTEDGLNSQILIETAYGSLKGG